MHQNLDKNRIVFSEPGDSEVIRIDNRGFHYRGELIEDAGMAHRLMVTFLQRHTSMHPEVVHQDNGVSLKAQALEALGRFSTNAHTNADEMMRDFVTLRKAVDRLDA